MTSLIDNTIDELIKRIKTRAAASDMRFITAYPPEDKPDPIDKYTVAVENKGVKKSEVFIGNAIGTGRRGSLCDIHLVLRTYAPCSTAAFALLRKTSLLADAAASADSDGAVVRMTFGKVEYDPVMRTLFRELHLTLRWLLSGEGAR